VVFTKAFGGGWEVIWHVADVVDHFRPCIEEVIEVFVCESGGKAVGEEPGRVVLQVGGWRGVRGGEV
jgi:hypothetical protein